MAEEYDLLTHWTQVQMETIDLPSRNLGSGAARYSTGSSHGYLLQGELS